MSDKEVVSAAIERLTEEFKLPGEAFQMLDDYDDQLQAAKDLLVLRISELIDSDLEKLMNFFYRIDVPEARVKDIFDNNIGIEIPDQLADMVIERQLQRAKTRIMYKKGKL